MKRKVRIYKDPNGNGGYINKTAQWLRRAQEGTQTGVTPVTANIMQQMQAAQPQQMQPQQQQPNQDDMLNTVLTLAQQGYGKDDIKNYIISQYGFEKGSPDYTEMEPQVLAYIDNVFEQIDSSSSDEENYSDEDKESFSDLVGSQETDTEEDDNSGYNVNDDIIMDVINEDSEANYVDEEEYKYGGVPNKRSFIKKTVRKLKRAQQGDEVKEANTANVRGTETNPTGITGNKDMFIAGVKGQAEDHFLQKQAEQMYNNQFGQGINQEGDMDYAQRGGWKMRRANRKMFGSPMLPPGVTSSKYSFGPLGGVRTAEVQYNPLMMASMFPMMTFPGMGGYSSSGYSWNQPTTKKSTGRIVIEKIASAVNNESTEDVANATNSNAANKSAEGPCTEEQVKDPNSPCYDPMYSGDGPVADNQNANTNTTVSSNNSTATTTTPVTNNTNSTTTTPVVTTPVRNVPVVSAPDPADTSEEDALREELNNSTHRYSNSRKDASYVIKDGKYYVAPNYNNEDPGTEKWYEVTDPERIKNIKKYTKEDQISKYYHGLEGKKDIQYYKDTYGNWMYDTKDNKGKEISGSVTNKETLNKLKSGKSKSNLGMTIDSKPGYYYRVTESGEYIKFKGDPKNHNSKKKPIQKITKKNNPSGWNYLTKQNNTNKASFSKLNFQEGGSINNPFEDQYGSLQKFIYGDEIDNVMLNALNQPINQSDLDYTDSKDVTDPYFRDGGLYAFQGEGDSETDPTNTGKTYNQEELDKLLAEKQKTWETEYQDKLKKQQQQQQQQMQQYMYPRGYGAAGVGQPVWGYQGGYGGFGGRGMLGAFGNLYSPFTRGASNFSPVGNPLQYAATAAGITKSGMLPTGMKYSKERKQDGNWFEKNLGFNKDRVWTIDYATPDQIKAQGDAAKNTPAGTNNQTNGDQQKSDASNLSFRDRRLARRDERLNRDTPAEADTESFTGTLTGSTDPQSLNQKTYDQEVADFQANQKKQGLIFDEKSQKWVPDYTFKPYQGDGTEETFAPPVASTSNPAKVSIANMVSPGQSHLDLPGNRPVPEKLVNLIPEYLQRQNTSQGANQNLVTNTSPKSIWDANNVVPNTVSPKPIPQSNLGPVGVRSSGMINKSAEEIRDAYRSGTSNPTVINRGNTTYINAAGEPIDVNDPTYSDEYAYGGFIPNYMAYGGYLPQAGPGIDVSSVSFAGNPVVGLEPSSVWGDMTSFGTNQNIKNPNADSFKNYTVEPDDLKDCTYEQKLDTTSKCYDPQTAQLKIKEEKSGTINWDNISRGALDAGANIAGAKDYLNQYRTNYIPGMTEFARGEKQTADERLNRGMWNARTGKEDKQGFEGVIKKGGSIGYKKNNEYRLTMSEIHDLLRDGGLLEFLD